MAHVQYAWQGKGKVIQLVGLDDFGPPLGNATESKTPVSQ